MFTGIVEENPNLHFRAIIKLLKEKGLVEDYNGDNFKQMKEKMQEVRQQRKAERESLRKQKKQER